jgi:hypothetical protein
MATSRLAIVARCNCVCRRIDGFIAMGFDELVDDVAQAMRAALTALGTPGRYQAMLPQGGLRGIEGTWGVRGARSSSFRR